MGLHKIKVCETCGEEFLAHIAQKWCPKCKKEREEKIYFTLTCPFCGKKFTTVKTNKKFCNDEHKRAFHSREYYRRKDASKKTLG